MTGRAEDDNALASAVLRMRRIGRPEAPFAGWLARSDDVVVHLVDTAELRRWPGWRARGEHVLTVHDVVRTARGSGEDDDVGGHEAALSWCVERVDAFLARRRSVGAELSAGEIVTIVVSLLRGCVAARAERLTGSWWLTHDGTPTFVCGMADDGATAAEGETIADAASALIESVAGFEVVTDAWRLPEIATIVRGGADVDAAESHLFALATPDPLVLAPLTPRRAAEVRRAPVIDVVGADHPVSWWNRLAARHIDTGIADTVSDALEGARRATERVRRRVARPWMLAAGIAGLIVVGGLAWPTSTAPPANARPAASDSPASHSASPSPASSAGAAADSDAAVSDPSDHDSNASPGAASVDATDPVIALSAALDVLASCGTTPCADALFEDPDRTDVPDGAVDLPSARRSIALLDDLGGVAILSVEGRDGSAPMQLVVLVRTDQRWLIREVRDVEGS